MSRGRRRNEQLKGERMDEARRDKDRERKIPMEQRASPPREPKKNANAPKPATP
jgi:hypothetical protein